MTTEQKALALVKKARQFCTRITIGDEIARQMADELERAIEREQAAIEAHEADKKAFSDAAHKALSQAVRAGTTAHGRAVVIGDILSPFILSKPEPDPLVEALERIAKCEPCHCMSCTHMGELARQALAARGWKTNLERIDND